MKLQRLNAAGVFVFGLGIVAIGAISAGCTASASGSITVGTPDPTLSDFPSGCTQDSTLDCTGNSLGITCPTGTSPDSGQYYCSIPTSTSAGDSFCCLTWDGGSDCTDDPSVTCPDPNSFGFSCQNGDTPDQGDNTLTCSVPGGTGQQYCCTDGTTVVSSSGGSGSSGGSSGGGTPTCSADSSLQCDAGSDGYSCDSGAAIATDDPNYICSDPTQMSDGSSGYCCITNFSGGTCTQDDSVTGGCAYPSIGFTCTGSDSPSDADSSLTCSVPGGNGMQFCCQ
jgi:hypothetical protein